MGFDPVEVAKLNEKKTVAPGSIASSLLSEPKLRAVIENARQILKVSFSFDDVLSFVYMVSLSPYFVRLSMFIYFLLKSYNGF